MLGTTYPTNPRNLIPSWCWIMLRVWRMCQGGEMGAGRLPDAGGVLDQSTLMMAAFGVMDQAEADLKR